MAKVKDTLKRDISFDEVTIVNGVLQCEEGNLIDTLNDYLPDNYDSFSVKIAVSLETSEEE